MKQDSEYKDCVTKLLFAEADFVGIDEKLTNFIANILDNIDILRTEQFTANWDNQTNSDGLNDKFSPFFCAETERTAQETLILFNGK